MCGQISYHCSWSLLSSSLLPLSQRCSSYLSPSATSSPYLEHRSLEQLIVRSQTLLHAFDGETYTLDSDSLCVSVLSTTNTSRQTTVLWFLPATPPKIRTITETRTTVQQVVDTNSIFKMAPNIQRHPKTPASSQLRAALSDPVPHLFDYESPPMLAAAETSSQSQHPPFSTTRRSLPSSSFIGKPHNLSGIGNHSRNKITKSPHIMSRRGQPGRLAHAVTAQPREAGSHASITSMSQSHLLASMRGRKSSSRSPLSNGHTHELSDVIYAEHPSQQETQYPISQIPSTTGELLDQYFRQHHQQINRNDEGRWILMQEAIKNHDFFLLDTQSGLLFVHSSRQAHRETAQGRSIEILVVPGRAAVSQRRLEPISSRVFRYIPRASWNDHRQSVVSVLLGANRCHRTLPP